jgi:hypothetical protein
MSSRYGDVAKDEYEKEHQEREREEERRREEERNREAEKKENRREERRKNSSVSVVKGRLRRGSALGVLCTVIFKLK